MGGSGPAGSRPARTSASTRRGTPTRAAPSGAWSGRTAGSPQALAHRTRRTSLSFLRCDGGGNSKYVRRQTRQYSPNKYKWMLFLLAALLLILSTTTNLDTFPRLERPQSATVGLHDWRSSTYGRPRPSRSACTVQLAIGRRPASKTPWVALEPVDQHPPGSRSGPRAQGRCSRSRVGLSVGLDALLASPPGSECVRGVTQLRVTSGPHPFCFLPPRTFRCDGGRGGTTRFSLAIVMG